MAIAAVNSATYAGSSSGSSTTVAMTNNQTFTSGNCIVGWVSWEDTTATVTVADGGGVNTYSVLTQPTPDGVHGCLFYALNITGFTGKVTATLSSAAPFKNLEVMEYSGIATSSALDGQNVGRTPDGTSTTVVTGSVTSAASDVLLCVGVGMYGSVTATPNAFWTRRSASASQSHHFFDKITTAGTYSVAAGGSGTTAGISIGSQQWVAGIAAFQGAAAGGGGARWALIGGKLVGGLLTRGLVN